MSVRAARPRRLGAVALVCAALLAASGCAGPDAGGASGASGSPGAPGPSATSSAASIPTPPDVAGAAADFAASLDATRRAELVRDHSFALASGWTGAADAGAPGVLVADLDPVQRAAFDTLLDTALGAVPGEGADEVRAALAAEAAAEGPSESADDGAGESVVESPDESADGPAAGTDGPGGGGTRILFLNEPVAAGYWELRMAGPGLLVSNTYLNGVLYGSTPALRTFPVAAADGGEGADAPAGGNAAAAGAAELEAIRAIIASLDDPQRAQAHLEPGTHGILLGPGRDGEFPVAPEGVVVTAFTPSQKALVTAAFDTVCSDVEPSAAARAAEAYGKQIDGTYFAYAGTDGFDQPGDTARLDGLRIWVEVTLEAGPHGALRAVMLWRDKAGDYGGATS